MTLDIPKFIENSVRTQSKIHHLDVNVKAVKVDDIPKSVKDLVSKDYGEKYLNDADYVAFFWGGIGKDHIDKLFNVVDKALGKSANKLTDKDFKKLHMDDEAGGSEEETEEVEDIEVDEEVPGVSDEEEPEEQQSSSDGNEEEEDEEEEVEVSDEEKEDDEEEDDEEDGDEGGKLNEDDDESIEIEDTTVEKTIPTSYFFLKVTSK